MSGSTSKTSPSEDIPLPVLKEKDFEFAPQADSNQNTLIDRTHHNHVHTEPLKDDIQYDSDSTDTNSSDEFNWDEDEDARSEHHHKMKAKRGRAVYLCCMRLARPVRVMFICILGAGILIAPLLVFELRFRNSIVRPHVYAWSLWLSIIWVAACLTYAVVDLVPRLVIRVVVLFGGQVERLKMQIELIAAVSAWLKLALDISWAWIALSVIRTTYHPPGSYWIYVNRVMQALFSAGLIILAEKVFLRFVAINFHQKALAERLAENRLGLEALDRLSNAQPNPQRKSHYGKKGHKSTASVDLIKGHRNGHGASSSTNSPTGEKSSSPVAKSGHAERKRRRRKFMASIIVDQVGGAIGQVALKDSKFHKQGDLGSLESARKLARKLFNALSDVHPPRSHLVVEDFQPYFRSTADAHAAFAVFDKDGNGDISKKEMREAVQRIYRERKALVSSVKDIDSAVSKLDAVLMCIALVGIIFICLLVFNRKNTLASLVPLATLILGFSFIFGHSAQVLFESLIFIFSTHVFDVGDLVMIDDQVLFVKEFGLFSTTFKRVDGQTIVAPNALLASSKLVHNIRRSGSMWETTTLMVSYDTPLEVIEQLRTQIGHYINENNREWNGYNVNIDKMEFQNAIHLVIGIEHRRSWQDWGGRWARRTEFMRHLKAILEGLDVKYTMPVQPVLLPKYSPFDPSSSKARSSDFLGMASADPGSNPAAFHGAEHLYRSPSRNLRV